jgi:pimeloyl-ACP methyl ester carboxylesterase
MQRPHPDQYLKSIPAAEGTGAYHLGVIEFDDQGEPWAPAQMEAVGNLIHNQNQNNPDGVMVVLFIHGWKNTASLANERKGNLAQFKKVLARIAFAEQNRTNSVTAKDNIRIPRPVIGVYLSWRGLSIKAPLIKEATFWNRQYTADRIASAPLAEVLFKIMDAAKEHPQSKCVVIGHSFGGMILEKTITPALLTMLFINKEEGFKIPADLIVVANPAIPALEAKKFVDILERSDAHMVLEDASGRQVSVDAPLLASITSERDSATRWIFPFGLTLSSLSKRYRNYADPDLPSQRYLATHTSGHVKYFVSHQAEVTPEGVKITARPDSLNHTPYWIIRVPGTLISGHSDIFNERFADFIVELMGRSAVFNPDQQLKLIRDVNARRLQFE